MMRSNGLLCVLRPWQFVLVRGSTLSFHEKTVSEDTSTPSRHPPPPTMALDSINAGTIPKTITGSIDTSTAGRLLVSA
jgi:hypothetical protein